MKVKPASKLVRLLSKGQITLPIEFCRRLKIDSDTILQVSLKRGRIEIVPLRPVPQDQEIRDYSIDEIERLLKEDRIGRDVAAKVALRKAISAEEK